MARLADVIRRSRLTKFVYKTVQEPSVRAVAKGSVTEPEIKDLHNINRMEEAIKKSGRPGTCLPSNVTVPDFTAAGKSASNGRAERAVRCMMGQVLH